MSVLRFTAVFLVFSINAFDFNADPENVLTALNIFALLGSWTPVCKTRGKLIFVVEKP